MLRPESVVETTIPSIAGTSSRPAWVGVAPVAACRKSGTKTVIENSAAVARNSAALTTATVLVRRRWRGTMGSRAVRSRATRAPESAMVAPIRARIGPESQA